MKHSIDRGDVRPCWLIDPGIGCELSAVPKNRPVIIVSADEHNWKVYNQLIIVVPLTTMRRRRSPRWDEVVIEPLESGLSVPSVTVCNQVRAVDRLRLGRRIGRLSPETMRSISKCLEAVLAIGSERRPA